MFALVGSWRQSRSETTLSTGLGCHKSVVTALIVVIRDEHEKQTRMERGSEFIMTFSPIDEEGPSVLEIHGQCGSLLGARWL